MQLKVCLPKDAPLRILLIGEIDVYLQQYLSVLSQKADVEVDLLATSSNNLPSKFIRHIFYLHTVIIPFSPINYFLRAVFSFFLGLRLLLLHRYDAIHIQYVSPYNAYFLPLYLGRAKVIASFWGSDLATVPKNSFYRILQKIILKFTDQVHVQNEEYLELYRKYFGSQLPVNIVQFGLPIDFVDLDGVTETQMQELKGELRIAPEKIIVVCGFYAKEEKQHLYMIDEIRLLPKSVLDKTTFVFPLSYGDSTYADMVRNYLRETLQESVEWRTLDDFWGKEKIATFRRISAIVINLSTHDCMSATLLESLYCQAVVINGAWLSYGRLTRAGVYDHKLKECKPTILRDTLAEIVSNFSAEKKNVEENRGTIRRYGSWEDSIEQWLKLYR